MFAKGDGARGSRTAQHGWAMGAAPHLPALRWEMGSSGEVQVRTR